MVVADLDSIGILAEGVVEGLFFIRVRWGRVANKNFTTKITKHTKGYLLLRKSQICNLKFDFFRIHHHKIHGAFLVFLDGIR